MSSSRVEASQVTKNRDYRSRWLFAVLCFGGAGYILVMPLLMMAGPLDSETHVMDYKQAFTTPWMMGCSVVALTLMVFGIWHLRASSKSPSDSMNIKRAMRLLTIRLTISWILVTAALSLLGALYYTDISGTARGERARQHESVAYLKSQEITKWLSERVAGARLLASALSEFPLDRLSTDRDLKTAVEILFAQLMAGSPERVAVSLLSPSGKVLARTGSEEVEDSEIIVVAKSLSTQKPVLRQVIVDVHLFGSPPIPRMGFLVPLMERPGSNSVVAVLAIAVNPFDSLMPQIVSWPTPSLSSEVLVVRRDGNEVVFITPPKPIKPPPAPLAYKVPLHSGFPTAEAVENGDGVRFSLSSRGVEVLTASRQVNGIPWFVIAKTELDELAHDLQSKKSVVIFVIVAVSILAAVLLVLLWRGEYRSMIALRNHLAQERLAVAEHFAQLARRVSDIVFLVDPSDRIIEANEAAARAYGYTTEDLLQLTMGDLQASNDESGVAESWRQAVSRKGVRYQSMHRRKDSTTFPVEINVYALGVDSKGYRQAFVRDLGSSRQMPHG